MARDRGFRRVGPSSGVTSAKQQPSAITKDARLTSLGGVQPLRRYLSNLNMLAASCLPREVTDSASWITAAPLTSVTPGRWPLPLVWLVTHHAICVWHRFQPRSSEAICFSKSLGPKVQCKRLSRPQKCGSKLFHLVSHSEGATVAFCLEMVCTNPAASRRSSVELLFEGRDSPLRALAAAKRLRSRAVSGA